MWITPQPSVFRPSSGNAARAPVRSAPSLRCSPAQRGLPSLLPPAATLAIPATLVTERTPSTPRIVLSKRSTAFITGQDRQASVWPVVSTYTDSASMPIE